MAKTSIIAKNISVTLQNNDVLKDISFCLQPDEHLAIIGPSGSGKTMLAKVLAGQLFAKGSLAIRYDEQSSLPKKTLLAEQRNQFKNLSHTSDFYYQQRYNSFDNSDAQTVMDELYIANKKYDINHINQLLQQFGLYERHYAPLIQLSSGENKRFQLVKAILMQPQILLFDSPYMGLDAAARAQLHGAINVLAANGTTIILIADAHQLPDCITHIVELEKGTLKKFTTRDEFLIDSNSSSLYSLYSSVYSLPITKNKDQYEYIVNMHNVNVGYENKCILHNINWQIKPGSKWLLRGHNGAGKSTLLSLINGDNPQAYKNEIYLFDKRRGTGESIWDIKQKIGFVSPELHAFYDKQTSCFNTIASGFFDTIGLFKKISETQHHQVLQWIEFLHLSSVSNRSIATLSFGTQRLILLARALVKDPALLILDEPCQGLDDEQKEVFINLINDICEQFNKTLIYVSHYDNEIPDCIEQVLELKDGKPMIHFIEKNEFATV